jgi:hypothetical protein
MGEKLFKERLQAGDLGISDSCGGIAGYPVVSSQLHTIDIILVEFWTSVEVMQVIQSGSHWDTSIKHWGTLFNQLREGDANQEFSIDLGYHSCLLDRG